jgi:NtrC-family two-component system sensor histidine kinase KinB
MNFRHLKTSFILAGGLVVATTAVSGTWSWLTFLRLSRVTGTEIQTSKETIELATELPGILEREDDALLMSISGAGSRASADLGKERARFDRAYERLLASLNESGERAVAADLRDYAAEYRRLGDLLLSMADLAGARDFYHKSVNPALRRAIGACAKVRELNFRSIEAAGIAARDEASRSTWIVLGISLAALVISSVVSLRLARSVVLPMTELSKSLDAVRTGDFSRQVSISSQNELGRMAEGFNRMTQALSEFHRLNVKEVLQAKERLEATLAALPDAVFLLDSQGGIISMSPLARKIAGHDMERGRRITDLALPDECLAAVGQALKGDPRAEIPVDLGRAVPMTFDGRTRSFLPRVLPVSGDSAVRSGAVVVLYDVTELAKLDELRTEMVAVASHELKTPLTTLRMNLLLLEESLTGLSAREQEILATALLGCRELQSTVDELLDLGRIEAGQLRLSFDRIEMNAVVGDLIAQVSGRFDGANIDIELHPSPRPVYLRGDAARIRIALSNLLDNALKYTPAKGRVKVEVSVNDPAPADDGSSVSVAVTDTGPGIRSEFRDRIFEKFFRVEHQIGGQKPGVGGAGIGLYLTRQIIEAHGGRVWCESGEGGIGSRFSISLRAEPANVSLSMDREIA